MFSSFYLSLLLISKGFSVLILLLIVSLITSAVFFVMRITDLENEEREFEKYRKKGRIAYGVNIFIILLIIFYPSQKQILTYCSLKAVDEYNIENVDSNYTIDKTLQNGDLIINTIMSTSEIVKNYLEEQRND